MINNMHKAEWESPEYDELVAKLHRIGAKTNLAARELEHWERPARAVIHSLSIRCDDGHALSTLGYFVRYPTIIGPALSGLHLTTDASLATTAVRALLSQCRFALAGLPFTGGAAAVVADPPAMSRGDLRRLTQTFIGRLAPELDRFGDLIMPGKGTSGTFMTWSAEAFHQATGRAGATICMGKPQALGGLNIWPEAAGVSLALSLVELTKDAGGHEEPTVVIQGFGLIGSAAARTLSRHGFKVIGISDLGGSAYAPQGLDIEALIAHWEELGTVKGFPMSDDLPDAELLSQEATAVVLAARHEAVTPEAISDLHCRYLVEGTANALPKELLAVLREERGIELIPYLLATFGEDLASFLEWRAGLGGATGQVEVHGLLEAMILDVLRAVREMAGRYHLSLAEASYAVSLFRLSEAWRALGTSS